MTRRLSRFRQLYVLVACIIWLLCAPSAIAAEYYVSNSGDDGKSGTAPGDAWQSIAKVNGFPFAPGDVVYFNRGGVWRGSFVPQSGTAQGHVTYTVYGDGPKPLILGSVEKNQSGDWEQVDTNLWRAGPFPVDVGNIIFDDGRTCGIKVWNREDVGRPNKFWYDREHKTILLYATHNPAATFDDIECALKRHIINQGGKSYVVYDGLHLAYGAAHGIGGGGTHHIVVRNCDLCFIGGGHQHSKKTARGVRHVRYGNGIEFWDSAHDNLVEGCHIWDIYDAGLTNQGGGRNQQYNITYRNNIVWNCEYSFEYWNRPAESQTHDIYFEDNVCYNAGRGWSHAQRPWPAGVHLMFFSNQAQTDRFFVRRNVFHHAETSFMNIHVAQWNGLDGLVLCDNTHCQPPEKVLVWWGDRSFTAGQFAEYQQATGKDVDSQCATLRGLVLAPDDLKLSVGATRQIKAIATYSNGAAAEVTPVCRFTLSEPEVIAIDSRGLLRATRSGKTAITATFEGLATTGSVVVQEEQ